MLDLKAIFVDLSQNIALLFALTFAYGLLLDYFDKQAQNVHFTASGALFGSVALIGMSLPIDVGDGVFVDGRFVVLAIGATLNGSGSALIAGILTTVYRLAIGGDGAAADIGAIWSVLLLGYIMHRYQEKHEFRLAGTTLLVLGIGSAAAHMLWFLMLPDDALDIGYGKLAVTVFSLYPAGVFLLGRLIAHENQRIEQELELKVRNTHLEGEVAAGTRALKESETQFRAVTENTTAGIWIVQDGMIRYSNPAAETITGYAQDKLFRTAMLEVIDPASHEIVERMLAGGNGGPYEVLICTSDGTQRQVSINNGHVNYEGKPALILTAFDITRLKSAEMAEREQRGLAEALRDSAIAVTQSLDLSEVLDRIVDNLGQVVPYDVTFIMIIEDGTARVVRTRDQVGDLVLEPMKTMSMVITDTPNLLRLVETGEPFILPDLQDYSEWVQVNDVSRWHSYLGITVRLQDEAIGFLHLITTQRNFFTERHAELLKAFAAQAATAIQNARLHERAQQLAAEGERQRLARDLHDSVTQTLFSANVIAQTLLKTAESRPQRVPDLIQQIYELNQNAYTEMRVLLLELRPDQLIKNSLKENLKHLLEVMRNRSEKKLILNAEDGIVLPEGVHIAFYRIAQESLNNAIKHASADLIQIELQQDAERVRMEIRDGGKGFKFETVIKGMGLDTMRERALGIGAEIFIESAEGQGTSVAIAWRFPTV